MSLWWYRFLQQLSCKNTCFAPTAIVLMKFRVAITRYLDVFFIFLDCYSTVELANFQIPPGQISTINWYWEWLNIPEHGQLNSVTSRLCLLKCLIAEMEFIHYFYYVLCIYIKYNSSLKRIQYNSCINFV